MSRVVVGKIVEIIEHPFGKGNLTSDGVQWSDEATSTLGTYVDVESITINQITPAGGPGGEGTLIEVEFGITWAQKCDGATDKAIGKIQARNKDGTWTNLMNGITNATAGTTYEERTYSGRFETVANFQKVPFDVKVMVKSNGTTNNAIGKVKNSSYVKCIYRIA